MGGGGMMDERKVFDVLGYDDKLTIKAAEDIHIIALLPVNSVRLRG
jgi:hypothetical protein